MLGVRPTEPRKIISHYDPFLALVPEKVKEEYCNTLDIAALGDLSQYDGRPTIFVLYPLKTAFEDMAFSTPPDYWGLFSTHVKEIKNFPKEIDMPDKVIDYKHRADFTPEVVQNIGSICIALSNRGNQQIFFTKPVNAEGFWQATRVALKTREVANTVDAKIKSLKSAGAE
jgi:hypothetical protein